MNKEGFIAATRFGMGVRPDDAEIIFRNPMEWLVGQIQHPESTPDLATLFTSRDVALKLMQARKDGDKSAVKEVRKEFKDLVIEELRARVRHAVTSRNPFYERLVNFWSNHFTVSVKKSSVTGIAGSFEREAIRPNILGNFADMMLAVAHHPAMLLYLDNASSSGPDSKAGIKRGIGLNENLAREIMELHTLGVEAQYTQTDVTNFAKVLTGWSIGRLGSENAGSFEFAKNRHEPGPQMVFGTSYPDAGELQGIGVLKDLSASKFTARHIAFKLARHFISDRPPRTAVEKLQATFLSTNGNLKALYETLLNMPEVWAYELPKIKSGYDLVISAARLSASDKNPNLDYCLQSLKFLGNIPFTAESPAGFPDTIVEIAGPDEIMRRIEWGQLAAVKLEPGFPFKELANISIGPILSDTTKDTLAAVENEKEGMALLLASPEFQRR